MRYLRVFSVLLLAVGLVTPVVIADYKYNGNIVATGTVKGNVNVNSLGPVKAGSYVQTGSAATASLPTLTSGDRALEWDSTTGQFKAWNGSAWVTWASLIGLTDPLTVPHGGTGTTSFLLNGVLIGGATSAIGNTLAGSAYQPLRVPSGGGAPAFGPIDVSQAGVSVTGIQTVPNGGTGAASFTAAKLIGSDASSTTAALRPITLGTGLTFSGSTLNAASGVATSDSPTWTGLHVFTPSSQSANTLTVNQSGSTYAGLRVATVHGHGIQISKTGDGSSVDGTAALSISQSGTDTDATALLDFSRSGGGTGPFIRATNGSTKFEFSLAGGILAAGLANGGYLSTDGSGNFIANVGTPLTSTPTWDSTLAVGATAARTITTQSITPSANATYSVGASGGNQFATGYFTGNVNAGQLYVNLQCKILAGVTVPSGGAGIAAPEGSLYLYGAAGDGRLYLKTGAADTAWTLK